MDTRTDFVIDLCDMVKLGEYGEAQMRDFEGKDMK